MSSIRCRAIRWSSRVISVDDAIPFNNVLRVGANGQHATDVHRVACFFGQQQATCGRFEGSISRRTIATNGSMPTLMVFNSGFTSELKVA